MMKFGLLSLLLLFLMLAGNAQVTLHTFVQPSVVGKDYLATFEPFEDLFIKYWEVQWGGSNPGNAHSVTMISQFNHCSILGFAPGSEFAMSLSQGDTVGPGNYWLPPYTGLYGYSLVYHDLSLTPPAPFYCKYFGIRQYQNGDTLYGWLAVEKDTIGGEKLWIKGYGIGQVPGQAVVINDNCVVGMQEDQIEPLQLAVVKHPGQDLLSVDGTHTRKATSLQWVDLQGRVLMEGLLNPGQALQWDLQPYAKGLYLLRATDGRQSLTRKVLLE